MTKKEYIRRLSEKTGLQQKDCATMIEALTDILRSELKIEKKIKIPKIGTLTVSIREERMLRNPLNNQPVLSPRRKIIRFTASEGLRKFIND